MATAIIPCHALIRHVDISMHPMVDKSALVTAMLLCYIEHTGFMTKYCGFWYTYSVVPIECYGKVLAGHE